MDSSKLQHALGIFYKYDADLFVGDALHAHEGDYRRQNMIISITTVATQTDFIEDVLRYEKLMQMSVVN